MILVHAICDVTQPTEIDKVAKVTMDTWSTATNSPCPLGLNLFILSTGQSRWFIERTNCTRD